MQQQIDIEGALTASKLSEKARAYAQLCDRDPVIYIRGVFESLKGEPIFLERSWAKVIRVGRKYITISLGCEGNVMICPESGERCTFCFAGD